jgi:hypothetical protein
MVSTYSRAKVDFSNRLRPNEAHKTSFVINTIFACKSRLGSAVGGEGYRCQG